METSAPATKPLHPLAWAAGIALIVFSAVGVGAFMGWIPSSMGGPSDTVAVDSGASALSAPAVAAVPPAVPVAPVVAANPAPPVQHTAPVRHQAATQEARNASVHAANRCAECGVVESVQEIQAKGQGSGLGAVGGAVLGAIVGNQVGGGHGKDAMTVVGAVGGGLAGNEVEKRMKSSKSYSTTVRMDDGTSRAFSNPTAPGWHIGDKVRIVDGALRSNS